MIFKGIEVTTKATATRYASQYEAFNRVVGVVVDQIQGHTWKETGTTKRRLKGDDEDKLRLSVERLIRDSVAVVLTRKRKGQASIDLGKTRYGQGTSNPDLGYNIHIERAYRGMLELGLLEVTAAGYYSRNAVSGGSKSKLTRYVATDHLLAFFTEQELKALPALIPPRSPAHLVRVGLRDDSGNKLRAVEAKTSMGSELVMAMNLRTINKVLEANWVDVQLPDEVIMRAIDWKNQNKKGSDDYVLDFSRRSLYRVFNSHSLDIGGRFYGAFWHNMPKELRRYLLIDGKETVEVDYSSMHPAMLYAMADLDPPDDAYAAAVDLLELPTNVDRNAVRSMVKQAFNAMLNALKPMNNAPDGIMPKVFGLKWRQVSDAVLKVHEPIAHHFYTGVGGKLQRMDSDIAEMVMLDFATYGIPILPVHDSFLMHHGYEEWLKASMEEAFFEVVGRKPDLKVTSFTRRNDDAAVTEIDEFGEYSSFALDVILRSMDVGYEHRLDAHRQLMRNNLDGSNTKLDRPK